MCEGRRWGVSSVAPALPSCGEAGLPGGVGGPLPRTSPRCGRCCGPETSRPWSPTATAASSPRKPPRASGRCAICCWSPATCPRPGRACRIPRTAAPPRSSRSTPTPARSGSAPNCSWTRSCRTAPPRSAGGGPPRPAERAGDRAAGRGAAAGQQVPSTYLVCAQDRGTPPRLQREFARRAGSVVELDAGHHSFLSQPEAVRDLFAEPVTAAADEPGRRSEGQEAAVQPGHRRHRHPHRTEVRMALLKGAGIGGTPHHSLLGRAPEAGSLNTVPVERRIRPRASARSGRTGGHSRRAAGRGYGPPGRLPRVA
ncbi:alpha/beta fold hydrolase [Streptomyces antimycoticus]|uniref:alpha/beta fold hydrolase n=1 Tax=Streptomyces antimycoticus TaxID=68175 RepID=UPI0036EBDE3E